MKRCDNCFENNTDGAAHCVICGEPLAVKQIVALVDATLPDIPHVVSRTFGGAPPPKVATPDSEPELEAEVESPASEAERDDVTLCDSPQALEICACDETDDEDAAESSPDAAESDEADTLAEVVAAVAAEVALAAEDKDPTPIALPTLTAAESMVAAAAAAQSAQPVAAPGGLGQVVLQVFHDTEPRVVYSHPVKNDITLIGREDPRRDVFPDLDLGKLSSLGVSADRVSRQHLRLLRQGGRHFLFVYRGTTGTQVNQDLIEQKRYGKRFEIGIGDRIILGGKVRMKLVQA
jgi:hypothetical protein